MPPSKRDFINLVTDEQRIQERATVMAAGLLRTAAVHAQELTAHPAWNTYLQQIEALRIEADNARKASLDTLPTLCTLEDITKYQQIYWFHAGLASAYAKAMHLPHEILSAHKGPDTTEKTS